MDWLNRETLLVPWPQEIAQGEARWTLPQRLPLYISAQASAQTRFAAEWLADDLIRLTGVEAVVTQEAGTAPGVRLALAGDSALPNAPATPGRTEGYALSISEQGALLVGDDEAGLAHAAQTLAQWVAFQSQAGSVPAVTIRDWPHYALRSVMLDMGRAPHPRALIERVIRILARLKLNALHLHLHDDELNGVRYETMPLGSENPAALPIREYGELIQYAKKYHIHVIPELEAWGHVSSLIYHYPELYGMTGTGTTGTWGQSFGGGEATYAFLERLLGEWVPLLEGTPAYLHLGLDEADWSLLPEVPAERAAEYTPVTHVGRLYEIVQRLGKQHGKEIEVHVWADHGGRPVPKEIEHKIVAEPWQYHQMAADSILKSVHEYGGLGKPPFIMGAGASFVHEQGAFTATKLWCREARQTPNCRGVTICLWGTNDIAARLVSVFAGADYAWTPETPPDVPRDTADERLRGIFLRRMKFWQAHFPDGDPDALTRERGREVLMGQYVWPPEIGAPAGPTVHWDQLKPRKKGEE